MFFLRCAILKSIYHKKVLVFLSRRKWLKYGQSYKNKLMKSQKKKKSLKASIYPVSSVKGSSPGKPGSVLTSHPAAATSHERSCIRRRRRSSCRNFMYISTKELKDTTSNYSERWENLSITYRF